VSCWANENVWRHRPFFFDFRESLCQLHVVVVEIQIGALFGKYGKSQAGRVGVRFTNLNGRETP
jgi:hypothetical protein